MSEYTEEQAQADADRLVARLGADAALRDALVADPRGTLEAEGLPAEVIDDLERAMGGAEVEGFASFDAFNFKAITSLRFTTIANQVPTAFGTQTATCAGGTTSRGPEPC